MGARFSWKSAMAAYLRLYGLVVAAAGLCLGILFFRAWDGPQTLQGTIFSAVGIIAAALSVYAWGWMARPDPRSILERRLIGSVIGCCALPGMLTVDAAKDVLAALRQLMADEDLPCDPEILRDRPLPPAKLRLAYVTAIFATRLGTEGDWPGLAATLRTRPLLADADEEYSTHYSG